MRTSLRIVLVTTLALTGCSALLDVKDLYFDPNAGVTGGPDGSTDGPTTNETGTANDGGTESSTCFADLLTDSKNCGRCGHDCVGGACNAGKCEAVELGTIADAPLQDMVVTDQFVFVSTYVTLSTQNGGVYRSAKTPGTPELYAKLTDVAAMAVLGDLLYFVVDDNPADGTPGQFGGLYSCPIAGAAPCTPSLIAAATNSQAITVDQNKVFYGDNGPGRGIMMYTPITVPPVVVRNGFGIASNLFVDGTSVFYTVTVQPSSPPQRAEVFEAFTDGGVDEKYVYASDNANDGRLVGFPTTMFFTAFDYQTTTTGIVRRIPRNGGAPCDYGGKDNKRPYGIHVDGTRIYWTNLGDGADRPFLNGSVVSCDQATCCTTPDVLWAGNGQPTAIGGDATAVYFGNNANGALWKIAKP